MNAKSYQNPDPDQPYFGRAQSPRHWSARNRSRCEERNALLMTMLFPKLGSQYLIWVIVMARIPQAGSSLLCIWPQYVTVDGAGSIDIAQEILPHFSTKNLSHSRQRCEVDAMRNRLEDAAVMLHANTRPFQQENWILLLVKMDCDFS
jgi:hypothetical protein